MADNTTTPADVAALFADLRNGKLLQPASTSIVVDLLQHTVFGGRLVSGVPQSVPVAHKVGTDVGVYNDAGLILLQDRPYVVAVLSQDADESEAEPALARVSQEIYRFESSLGAAPSPTHPG
jgi:beta-lactamase class A